MKTIRTGVYGLVEYKGKIILIQKGRGPFTGLYDLPGGKIEHGEENKVSLQRELNEELGLKYSDFEIKELIAVEEDFVKHTWKGEEKDEHIIAIVYLVKITSDLVDFSYIENGGDSNGLLLINKDDISLPKTNITQKILRKI